MRWYVKTSKLRGYGNHRNTLSLLLYYGAPGVTRTPGKRFRKPLLYPPELRGRFPTKNPHSSPLILELEQGEHLLAFQLVAAAKVGEFRQETTFYNIGAEPFQ